MIVKKYVLHPQSCHACPFQRLKVCRTFREVSVPHATMGDHSDQRCPMHVAHGTDDGTCPIRGTRQQCGVWTINYTQQRTVVGKGRWGDTIVKEGNKAQIPVGFVADKQFIEILECFEFWHRLHENTLKFQNIKLNLKRTLIKLNFKFKLN